MEMELIFLDETGLWEALVGEFILQREEQKKLTQGRGGAEVKSYCQAIVSLCDLGVLRVSA